MNSKLLLTILLLSGLSVFSQTKFEPGYIIKSDGQKIDCLIKNEDWKGSPNTFDYKVGTNGDIITGTVLDTKEFGAIGNFKYIVETLLVDQSSDKVSNLSSDRNPDLKEETLFLKVLVEGDASLYYTIKNGENRFFYKMNDGAVEQLIYKRYFTSYNNIGENNRYKQQLATDFVCNSDKDFNFEKLEYKKSSLIKRFENFNNCVNSQSTVYFKKETKHGFNLSLRPGVAFGSSSIQKTDKDKLDFGTKAGFRIGLEAEYILPFNNGKWGLFAEPTYRTYQAEKEQAINENFPTYEQSTIITVEYNSIELPVGARYYMFLNNQSALFLNVAALIDISLLDSSFTSSNDNSYNLDFKTDTTVIFGAGFKLNNKYSIGARYQRARNIINYISVNSTYESFSLIAGYNFL